MPLKRLLIGRPLATFEEQHTRLPKRIALAVFASDAISSTAYATEEILHILVPVAGMAALGYLLPISAIVMVLLAIVVTSYRQTCYAYPNGGGAYVVARENLGELRSLTAGSSLLVDYVLTVAVSVSAGVAAVTSAFPELLPYKVLIGIGVVALMTLANLRGAKESGTIFAIPTYLYVFALASLLGYGLFRSYTGDLARLPVDHEALQHFTGAGQLAGVSALILMRAFSSGAVALSGTEAISNGIPAFQRPESRNASRTLIMMAVILGSFFFGISLLAQRLGPTLRDGETILSVMGGAVFGRGTFFYLFLQFSTMAILFLAANTAYADFPRLSSIIASDEYLPRQLSRRGDRLVFSNGVVALAFAACLLIAAFGGDTTALIPLYAVGVFTGFTISQWGMVVHHRRLREPGWRAGALINGVGSIATLIVTAVVVVSKFATGAWIPVVVIPLIVLLFKGIKRHYTRIDAALAVTDWRPPRMQHTVVVLVGRVQPVVLRALAYARTLAPNYLTAVTVVHDDDERREIERQWSDHGIDTPLTVISSPYRELSRVVMTYLDELDERWDNDIITVVIPEFVVRSWWENLLHGQTALILKGRLLFRRNTVVTSVPVHLD